MTLSRDNSRPAAGGPFSPAIAAAVAMWWRLSRFLGDVNARVLLTVLFAVLVVPLGVIWRVTGFDPLRRRRDAVPGWSPYPPRYRDRTHYRRMY